MEGTAVLGRVTWRTARIVGLHDETPTARTLALAVDDWPGHVAGQHVDVRLTAADGYSSVRSYSIASGPEFGWSYRNHCRATAERRSLSLSDAAGFGGR